ncbi:MULTISPECIES: hypothetical protein [unclassified Streptomyces]|uniref:hypothetical protein n=1 Tax=unclassified Streptomyces TaxID=2593676 RepID=UPI003821CD71
MNSSRIRPTGTPENAGNAGSTGSRGNAGDSATTERSPVWGRAARSPWTVLCAVAAVVLGPAATTASALEQANKAPMHHAVRVDGAQAYIPTDSTRRRLAA